MNITCDGLDLSDAVMKASKAIASKTTNPILEGIKLTATDNKLILSATDLELSIEKTIKAEVKVEGEVIVPGKFFGDFIRKLTNEKITLKLEDNNLLKIKYIDSEGCIQCFNNDEYPSFKQIDSSKYFQIKKSSLKNLINKTIFSVAIDDTHPILKGCLLEIENDSIKCVSSDGYRISLITENLIYSNLKTNCVVPDKSLKEITKILDDSDDLINVSIEKNFLMIDLEDTKIITRLLEGEFLNYKQILNSKKEETVITVNKEQLEDSLERASLLSKVGQNNLVKFDIDDQNMIITSNNEIGNIKEKVLIKSQGNDLVISFNARYFLEALKANDDEFVKISFSSSSYPCVITSASEENSKYLYLILPVRMLNN